MYQGELILDKKCSFCIFQVYRIMSKKVIEYRPKKHYFTNNVMAKYYTFVNLCDTISMNTYFIHY